MTISIIIFTFLMATSIMLVSLIKFLMCLHVQHKYF